MEDYERMRERCRHAGLSRMTSLTTEKRKEVSRLGGIARARKYPTPQNKLIRIQDAARRLKTDSNGVIQLVEDGKLIVTEFGPMNAMRFSVAEIERCKREHYRN